MKQKRITEQNDLKYSIGKYFVNLGALLFGANKLHQSHDEGDLWLARGINAGIEVKGSNNGGCFKLSIEQLAGHKSLVPVPFDHHFYLFFRYVGIESYRARGDARSFVRKRSLQPRHPTPMLLEHFLSRQLNEAWLVDIGAIEKLIRPLNVFTYGCKMIELPVGRLRRLVDLVSDLNSSGLVLNGHTLQLGLQLFGREKLFPLTVIVNPEVADKLIHLLRQRGMLAK